MLTNDLVFLLLPALPTMLPVLEFSQMLSDNSQGHPASMSKQTYARMDTWMTVSKDSRKLEQISMGWPWFPKKHLAHKGSPYSTGFVVAHLQDEAWINFG